MSTWTPSENLAASLASQMVKGLPAMREAWIRSLDWEDLLEKGMAIHSSILAGKIPCTKESGGLQSMGLQRIRHGCVTNIFAFTFLTLEPEGGDGRCGPAPHWWALLSTTASSVSSSIKRVILVIAPRSRRSEPRLQGNRDQSPGDAAPRGQDDGRGEIRAPGTAGGNVHGVAEEDRLMGPEMETLNHHGMPPFHS